MVRHHQRLQEPNWRRGIVINAVGTFATGTVLIIVAVTKFAVGAWLPIVKVIHRHYAYIERVLAVRPGQVRPQSLNHTVVVLVGRIHQGTIKALDYAKSLRPQYLTAVSVAYEEGDLERIQEAWKEFGFDIPLEVVSSPYRELVAPIEHYLDQLDERWSNDTITVVIPEFIVSVGSLANVLHGQSALALKLALLDRPGTVVTSVPFHIPRNDGEAGDDPDRTSAVSASEAGNRGRSGTAGVHGEGGRLAGSAAPAQADRDRGDLWMLSIRTGCHLGFLGSSSWARSLPRASLSFSRGSRSSCAWGTSTRPSCCS